MTAPIQDPGAFKRELAQLINRHSAENLSNTPDFILADMLFDALLTFSRCVQDREKWWGGREAVEADRFLSNAPPGMTPEQTEAWDRDHPGGKMCGSDWCRCSQ